MRPEARSARSRTAAGLRTIQRTCSLGAWCPEACGRRWRRRWRQPCRPRRTRRWTRSAACSRRRSTSRSRSRRQPGKHRAELRRPCLCTRRCRTIRRTCTHRALWLASRLSQAPRRSCRPSKPQRFRRSSGMRWCWPAPPTWRSRSRRPRGTRRAATQSHRPKARRCRTSRTPGIQACQSRGTPRLSLSACRLRR